MPVSGLVPMLPVLILERSVAFYKLLAAQRILFYLYPTNLVAARVRKRDILTSDRRS